MELFGIPLSAVLSQLLLGLVNGSFYAILSLGLAVIFGMLNIVNFAHGALYMVGAFFAWMLLNYAGINYWMALVIAPIGVGLIGVVIEKTMLRWLHQLDHLYGLLLTFGLALILEGVFREFYGSSGLPYELPDVFRGVFDLGFMMLPKYRVWVIVVSIVVCFATWYVIEKTKLGAYLRALTTVPLALGAFVVALLLALPVSVWLALLRTAPRGRYVARLVSAFLLLLDALPGFALALLLVALLGPQGTNWFPATGLDSREPQLPFLMDRAWHLVLPVLALSLGGIAHLARQLSTNLLQLEREEWMRAARANGLTRAQALRRHALPHALPPLIGLFGGALPALVSGAVVVETVFALQGLGSYATEAVLARDLSIVLATCTLAAVVAVVGSVLADELVRSLDPRSRQGDVTHG